MPINSNTIFATDGQKLQPINSTFHALGHLTSKSDVCIIRMFRVHLHKIVKHAIFSRRYLSHIFSLPIPLPPPLLPASAVQSYRFSQKLLFIDSLY